MRMKKVRICFFIGNMSHSGGTERVLSTVANGLSKRGYGVSVISLWGKGPAFFPLKEEVGLYWLQEKVRSFDVAGQLACLYGVLQKEKPDFWVDVDSILALYSVFLKIGRPRLCWVSWEHFSCRHHFRKNRLLRMLAKRIVCRFADWLVVLTDADRNYYKRHGKLNCRVARIYNPLPYAGAFSKKTERPVILAVGRLTHVKGYDLLLRSWKLLESKYPQWSVLVVGEGEDKKKLERQRRDAGLTSLHFTGKRQRVEKYYEKASFLVLPSRVEGFGMVLIEAMHYALPVVSFSCESGPKEIVEDGENGFLAAPGDVAGFAGRMERLMKSKDLRRRMGENAKKSAARFDTDVILDQWERLFRESIAQHMKK